MNVQQKYADAWALAGRLPATSQVATRARLTKLRQYARRRALGIGADSEWEWDLALANQLDRIYTATSEQATRVAKGVQSVVHETAKSAAIVGFGLWPIALAVGAVLYLFSRAKTR